jgi:hypothetical protein
MTLNAAGKGRVRLQGSEERGGDEMVDLPETYFRTPRAPGRDENSIATDLADHDDLSVAQYIAAREGKHQAYFNVRVERDSFIKWVKSCRPKKLTKPSGGRKPSYHWPNVRKLVFALMDHHGDFEPADLEWNAQARLEEAIREKLGVECAESTLRKYVSLHAREWRKKKVEADKSGK